MQYFSISWSLLKLKSIKSVLPSYHLILCCPLLLPSIFPSIRVFSNESSLHIRWPQFWSFSFSISTSNGILFLYLLKSRDITSLTKVCLVKAMVFPVVMHGCESWTIKKAEHQRIHTFELWCWRRLLRIPCTARRSDRKSVV